MPGFEIASKANTLPRREWSFLNLTSNGVQLESVISVSLTILGLLAQSSALFLKLSLSSPRASALRCFSFRSLSWSVLDTEPGLLPCFGERQSDAGRGCRGSSRQAVLGYARRWRWTVQESLREEVRRHAHLPRNCHQPVIPTRVRALSVQLGGSVVWFGEAVRSAWVRSEACALRCWNNQSAISRFRARIGPSRAVVVVVAAAAAAWTSRPHGSSAPSPWMTCPLVLSPQAAARDQGISLPGSHEPASDGARFR